jgi:hypothetical protein
MILLGSATRLEFVSSIFRVVYGTLYIALMVYIHSEAKRLGGI